MIIEIEKIKSLIPHRPPFLFVDKCEITEPGIKGKGYRKFLSEEYFFVGHFPEMPIVPGVILIEALAQTAGIIVSNEFENNKDKSVLFMSISKAKFRKPVFPNDEITFEVTKSNQVKSVYKFTGIAFNQHKKVCEAEFSAMITDKKNQEIL